MNTLAIVQEIDRIIDFKSLSIGQKCIVLEMMANRYWDVVFPERGTPEYEKLTSADRKARWDGVRARNELTHLKHSKEVESVIRWPATGETFDWLLDLCPEVDLPERPKASS